MADKGKESKMTPIAKTLNKVENRLAQGANCGSVAEGLANVAKEGVPLGGAQRLYHVHHRGTNASIHHWRQTRYAQGFDETHPESQIEFDKNGHPIKVSSSKTKDGKKKHKSESDE